MALGRPMSDLRDRTYGAIDGLADLDDQLAELMRRIQVAVPASPLEARRQLLADVTDTVAAGTLDDIDIAARVASIERAQTDVGATRSVLAEVHQDLAHRRALTLDAGRPAALRVLDTEVKALVRRVRELDTALSGVSSAEAAIRYGVVEAWAEMIRAATSYAEIRALQIELVKIGEEAAFAAHARRGPALFVNAERSLPALAWELEGGHGYAPDDPWPDPVRDPVGHVRWVATAAEPWVPSVQELAAEIARLDAIVTDRVVAAQGGKRPARREIDLQGGHAA